MRYSDKTFMGMTTSPKNAEDVMQMCDILFGLGFIDDHPVVTGNCNGHLPLVWDETMLGALRAFSRRNQPVLCSPRAWWREHPGISRAKCRSVERRGALSTGLYPSNSQRHTRHLRPLSIYRFNEIWRTHGRNARN